VISFFTASQHENVVKLTASNDIHDVTLVSDDYNILAAHRVILLSRKDLACQTLM
jgi:hypothetical protein